VESLKGRGGATLTFGVTNIDDARKQVEGKAVKFDGETRVIPGMVKLATFFDPDGNTLMFYQDLQKHP
jgi:predicted enzyme related to lactoylglutathione lyase